MDSQRIPGEGIEHEQNYIEERMINASHTDELAAQSERLKDEMRDLNTVSAQGSSEGSQTGSLDALKATASIPTSSQEVATQGRSVATGGPVDPEQLPPSSEARSRVVSDTGGGQMGS